LLAAVLWLAFANPIHASTVLTNPNLVGGKLVLTERSTVTITAWLGTASCRQGQITLVSPDLKLKYSSPLNEYFKNLLTQKKALVSKHPILIYNYGSGRSSVEIGPYPAGTEIILGTQTESFCKTSRVSTDKRYTHTRHNGGNSWTIAWEDYSDGDVDDLYTEITVNPVAKDSIETDIISAKAFAENPTYRLPYPAGVAHKFTTMPGIGEHKLIRAFDIDMKISDKIVASEMGQVLWIEDSFDSGSCSSSLRNRANVVVIQTETGVNVTYAHLDKGSVQLSGIKVGDIVKQGQWIGNAGNSGFVCSDTGTGSHLHFEWQHNCYDLTSAITRRSLNGSKPGEPTFGWSCTNFPADAPFNFVTGGKVAKITTGKLITSDNGGEK